MSDKIFRDPLYDYIAIDLSKDKWLLELLDTPEVQRLRRIHQLGIGFLSYPGAGHSRLSHSLGVLHLMQHALDHLQKTHSEAAVDNARMPLLAAALLHDVGHAPFSHVFERCIGAKHEAWSCKIISSAETAVGKRLGQEYASLPGEVAALVEKNNTSQPFWQKGLLSSQLDADRLDYLRRDSLMTGAGYGHFDWYRILHSFRLEGKTNQTKMLVWPKKSAYGIEEYIFSRFYMYQNVYLHHTTRCFERMLIAMWERAKRLKEEGTDVCLLPPIADFWNAQDPSPAQFLALEEHVVMLQIQNWKAHSDKSLSDLAAYFLDRKGFAMIEVPAPKGKLDEALKGELAEWTRELNEIARKASLDSETCCLPDDRQIDIYEPYYREKDTDEQSSINSIRILMEDSKKPLEISEHLPRVEAAMKKPLRNVAFFVHKKIRDEAKKLRDKMFRKNEDRPRSGA